MFSPRDPFLSCLSYCNNNVNGSNDRWTYLLRTLLDKPLHSSIPGSPQNTTTSDRHTNHTEHLPSNPVTYTRVIIYSIYLPSTYYKSLQLQLQLQLYSHKYSNESIIIISTVADNLGHTCSTSLHSDKSDQKSPVVLPSVQAVLEIST